MNILVTGAAGFIGSHLCETLLQSGFTVTGIDNFDPFYARAVKEANLMQLKQQAGFEFLEMDIESREGLKGLTASFDCVIHLAAKAGVLPSISKPQAYLNTNVQGTQNLLEFMKTANIRKYVFASSSSVYGNNKKIPFSEADSVDFPISPYAFTKKSAELLNHTYHHLYGLDIVNLRFFTVYGPRQRPDLAIHKFFKLIKEGRPVTMYGDGSTARDYTFVADTVQGIFQALQFVLHNTSIYEIFNLGNNHPVKLIDLVKHIYRVAGVEPAIEYLPAQPGDVDVTYADISKAKERLGYQPQTDLPDGLQAFYEWFCHTNT